MPENNEQDSIELYKRKEDYGWRINLFFDYTKKEAEDTIQKLRFIDKRMKKEFGGHKK